MLLTLVPVVILSSAPVAPTSAGDPPALIATTSIWADVADQLDCADHFEVQALIPSGGDPHSYEPSMADRDRLGDAALVVTNGAGLEETLADTLDAAAGGGTPLFVVADHVTLRATAGEHDEDEHDADDEDEHDGDDHGPVDPHVWLDPTRVVEAIPALTEELIAAGADADETAACADELIASLEQLDADIAALVEQVPPDARLLVTNHDALGYFADRYGFEILGSVLPSTSTLVEASAGELDELAAAIESAGVPAIFAEALEAADDASALGDRLGIDVVTLHTDSLGEPGSGADTYQGMLLADATAIVGALGAVPSE